MKSNKEIRREKLMNKPGKLGALWSENFENLKRLKAAAKAQGMKLHTTPCRRMNITDEMIEAVGREVGMAHGGWGEVNPRELMDAIWRVLCAAKASEGGKKSRRVLTPAQARRMVKAREAKRSKKPKRSARRQNEKGQRRRAADSQNDTVA